jgi:membrane protein
VSSGRGPLTALAAGVVRRLISAQVLRVAASLSFTTLLGLVPLFTVAFAYVAKFAVFQEWLDALEPFLLRFLLPGSSIMVRQYLAEFTGKSAGITGLGTAFVVLTAVLLVAQVEIEINAIWGIHSARSFLRRAIVYSFGFVAVPALIGAAVYFTSWAISQSVAAVPSASGAVPFVMRLLAIVLASLALTFIYAVAPARRVPLRAALIGGLSASVAFDVAKSAFTFYVRNVSTYQMVYGALAAIPLFLIWIYVSWIIVLAGAALSATLAERRSAGATRRRR